LYQGADSFSFGNHRSHVWEICVKEVCQKFGSTPFDRQESQYAKEITSVWREC
jgi:hypothetical protein